jgi:DNA-binding transcriptional MerR regulator
VSVLPPDSGHGVYGISVAAELTGLGVQTLRLYESRGLLEPARTEGGTRRYSADDLDRLSRIGTLLEAGLNLAGARMVMDLQDANAELELQNRRLQSENSSLRGGGPERAAPGSRTPMTASDRRPRGTTDPRQGAEADGTDRGAAR